MVIARGSLRDLSGCNSGDSQRTPKAVAIISPEPGWGEAYTGRRQAQVQYWPKQLHRPCRGSLVATSLAVAVPVQADVKRPCAKLPRR